MLSGFLALLDLNNKRSKILLAALAAAAVLAAGKRPFVLRFGTPIDAVVTRIHEPQTEVFPAGRSLDVKRRRWVDVSLPLGRGTLRLDVPDRRLGVGDVLSAHYLRLCPEICFEID